MKQPLKTRNTQLKTFKDVDNLKAVDLKNLCVTYDIDVKFPKKAKLVLLCQALGISTTGHNKQSSSSAIPLNSSQREEFEQLAHAYTLCKIKDWTLDLTIVPDVDEALVKKYLVQENLLDIKAARTYKLSRPYQLRQNIHSIKFFENVNSETLCVINAKCNPSQATNADEVKVLYVIIDKITGEPLWAFCSCTIGHSQTCGHVGAALFRLAELVASGLKEAPALTCTEQLCQWTDPKGSKSEPTIIDELEIKQKQSSIRRTVNDYGKKILNEKPPSYDDVVQLRANLFAATHDLGQYVPAVHILNCSRYLPTGTNQTQPQVATALTEILPYNCPELAFNKEVEVESCPLPIPDIKNVNIKSAEEFVDRLTYSESDIQQIENSTKGQSESEEWFRQRRGAITSSKFSSVLRASNKSTKPTTLVNDILRHRKPQKTTIPSLKWGLVNEKKARAAYSTKFSKFHNELVVTEHGLIVDNLHPFMRVSPDGIVTCNCHAERRLLEIKCPYASRNLTISEAVRDKKIKYLETDQGRFILKKNSSEGYYEQVQGTMGVTKIYNCNLVVRTPKDMVTVHVPFDKTFYETKLLPACASFFRDNIVTQIMSPTIEITADEDKQQTPTVTEATSLATATEATSLPTVIESTSLPTTAMKKDKPSTASRPKTSTSSKSSVIVSKKGNTTAPIQPVCVQTELFKCGQCKKPLPEENQLPDNSNASVGCDCPNCGGCNVWFCWPCARYDEKHLESGTDWYCPECTRECDLVL